MSGKNAVGFGSCVLLLLLASPPAPAGVVNGVLSQWNLQAKECKDGQIDLGAMVNVGMFEAVNRGKRSIAVDEDGHNLLAHVIVAASLARFHTALDHWVGNFKVRGVESEHEVQTLAQHFHVG